ncbi:hypothetical protein FRC10_005279 [Ceratobasidium sp. 414]|nr:hypothetical protein FRC10_005279 [Ceratobasidium sp. 414]
MPSHTVSGYASERANRLWLDGTVSAEDSEPETTKPKTRKRVRKDRHGPDAPAESLIKRGRGKQGKLKEIMNMPIEVFTEISKYLYPLDLILLSRANKFFRQLLLSRSATKTWRKYCSMCGKQAPHPMDPVLWVRLCASCRDQQISPVGSREHGLVPMSWTIIPATRRNNHLRCLRKDLTALGSKLDALRLAGNREATSCWIEKRKREMEQRTRDAQLLAKFLGQQETEQNDSLVARRGQREDGIRSRLLGLGWVEGDFEMRERDGAKQWKSLVCIAKPLTEHIYFLADLRTEVGKRPSPGSLRFLSAIESYAWKKKHHSAGSSEFHWPPNG